MKRFLSAPGKLFLAGEYAVLWGGAARVVAVGPRGHALVKRREDREVELVLEAGKLIGTLTPAGVAWRGEIAEAFKFAARAIDAAVATHAQEVLGFTLALSPSQEAAPGLKMGIGSSARATVLAVDAVRYILEARFDSLKLALWAHASAQGGKGSGGDVAASFAGGVVRYRRYSVEGLRPGPLLAAAPPVDLRRLGFPGLHLSYVFAGESASTVKLIGRVEEKLDAEARLLFVARSDQLGDALETALAGQRFGEVKEVVGHLHDLLCSLGPLETDGIRQIVALARTSGSVAKISGAGAGDGCIVLSPDAEAQQAMLEAFAARNIFALRLTPEAGLQGEAMPDPQLQGWTS